MSSELFCLPSLDLTGPFPIVRCLVIFFIEIPVFNANCVDLDQTPHYAASDLGLHCLPITPL